MPSFEKGPFDIVENDYDQAGHYMGFKSKSKSKSKSGPLKPQTNSTQAPQLELNLSPTSSLFPRSVGVADEQDLGLPGLIDTMIAQGSKAGMAPANKVRPPPKDPGYVPRRRIDDDDPKKPELYRMRAVGPMRSTSQPPSPIVATNRPGSASSMTSLISRFGFSRRDSSDSSNSTSTNAQPRSRGGSNTLKNAFKLFSGEVKKNLDVAKMNEEQRKEYYEQERAKIDRAIEEDRRANPAARPVYQKDFIARRHVHAQLPKDRNATIGLKDATVPIYDHLTTHMNQHPNLTALEREEALQEAQRRGPAVAASAQVEMEQRKPIPDFRGMHVAMAASRAVDILKRRNRIDSTDSGMDFADSAPVEALEICTRCREPTKAFLKHGMCLQCSRDTKMADDDSDSASSKTSVYSRRESPAPEPTNEDLSAKFANYDMNPRGQKMYEDPGNPFASDADAESNDEEHAAVPELPLLKYSSLFPLQDQAKPKLLVPSDATREPAKQSPPGFADARPQRPVFRHAISDFAAMRSPMPMRCTATPELIKQHERSMSIASLGPAVDYVPVRVAWRNKVESAI